jgi:hypothetical protein
MRMLSTSLRSVTYDDRPKNARLRRRGAVKHLDLGMRCPKPRLAGTFRQSGKVSKMVNSVVALSGRRRTYLFLFACRSESLASFVQAVLVALMSNQAQLCSERRACE